VNLAIPFPSLKVWHGLLQYLSSVTFLSLRYDVEDEAHLTCLPSTDPFRVLSLTETHTEEAFAATVTTDTSRYPRSLKDVTEFLGTEYFLVTFDPPEDEPD
jgi:hypothetical protein